MPKNCLHKTLSLLDLSPENAASLADEFTAFSAQISAKNSPHLTKLTSFLRGEIEENTSTDAARNTPISRNTKTLHFLDLVDREEDVLSFIQNVIEVVPAPLYVKDVAGHFVIINKAFETFFNCKRNDVLGKTLKEAGNIGNSVTSIHDDYDAQCIKTQGQCAYEALVFDRQKNTHECVFRKSALFSSDGKLLGLVATITDITEFRAQKEQIESVESRLKRIADTIPVAVFQAEVTEKILRYTYVSERVKEIRGLNAADILVDSSLVTDQIVEEDRSFVRQALASAGKMQQPWSGEFRIQLPNGDFRWIHAEYQPDNQCISKNNPQTNETSFGFTGIWQDVTSLKIMRSRLKEVMENIPVAVFQGVHVEEAPYVRFDFVSKVIEKITGVPASEMINDANAFFAQVDPEDMKTRETSFALDKEAANNHQRLHFDFRLTHKKTGEQVWIRKESQLHGQKGNQITWNGFFADVSTEKKVAEELLRTKLAAEAANRAKSEFLANMSHEIRTPMNGIIGMTELVLDTNLSEEQREHLLIVKSSSEALLTVLNDILDFSKIEAGKLQIESISFNLLRTIDDTLRTLALRAHDKGLELVSDIAPDTPKFVIGDPGRLRQIIINLIGNAIKFTERGEIVLAVACDITADKKAKLRFSVTDSGVGITPSKLANIFDAFSQEDSSITRKYGGTGLGLTISGRLAEALGGGIWVESEVGKGSTFHFSTLFAVDEDKEEEYVPDIVDLSGRVMLIVDDNPVNRLVLSRTLDGAGVTVREASSGIEALEMLQKSTATNVFDLIIMDANMPEMDGFMTAEAIFQLPHCAQMKMVMLSSGGARGDGELCRKLGFSAYLPKPVAREDLFKMLGRVLAGTKSVNEAMQGAHALITRHSMQETPSIEKRKTPFILLVEDHPVNQKLAARMLERWGYQVAVAENGQIALDKIKNSSFDVVLMDMMMPVMDGLEATRQIRAFEKFAQQRRTPIIAMTANAMKSDKEDCFNAGMDDFLTKPIKSQDFLQVLQKYSALIQYRAESKQKTGQQIQQNLPEPQTTQQTTQKISQTTKQNLPQGEKIMTQEVDKIPASNFDYALSLKNNADMETVEIICELFIEQCPLDLAKIGEALSKEDYKTASIVAHSLKGTFAMFVAKPANELALKLEKLTAGENVNAPLAKALFEALSIEADAVLAVLKSLPTPS